MDLARVAPAELGVRADERSGVTTLVTPALDVPLFNRVIGLGLNEPVSEDMLDRGIETFRNAGVENFAIQLSRAAEPRDTAVWLDDRHLAVRDNWSKMYRSREPCPPFPTELRIERATPDDAAAVADVVVQGFGMPARLGPWIASAVGQPGWHHYLAWNRSSPVAAATLRINDGVGWLGMATTLPSHRRRGAQEALLANRINDGRRMGCLWFVSETTEDTPQRPNPSFHNMIRAGFRLAYQRPNYMRLR